jgi:hypothetical protein
VKIVIGLSAGGEAMRRFRMIPALWLAVGVAVIALVLLLPISLSNTRLKVKMAEAVYTC